jgi:hypothetical protein
MAAHDEDLEDGLRPAKELLEEFAHADGPAHDLASITEALDPGVLFPELAHDEARVRRQDAHENQDNDAGCQPKRRNDGGQRQDTQRHCLSNHDHSGLPVNERISFKVLWCG